MPGNKETSASPEAMFPFEFTVSDPFDSDPGADVILISCDNAEFRARKSILSFISPIFSDMFSLPQPITDETRDETASLSSSDGLPLVHLSERGSVIDTLLRYCYPLADPLSVNAYLLIDALNAAEKYDMRYVISSVQASLNSRSYSQPESLLSLYRRAYDQHQEDDARRYAFESLTLSCSTIVRHWDGSSAGALTKLMDYHQAVSMAISNYIIHLSDNESGLFSMWGSCRKCNKRTSDAVELREWWTSGLLTRVQNIFENGPMSAQLLPSKKAINSKQCRFCHYCLHGNWEQFETGFSSAMRKEANQIKLVIP